MNISRSSVKTRFDVVIVGGGHNGLTCACYLAKSGLSVGVFERRSILGGAAVTEEFHPGFRNSTASYTVSLLNPKVIQRPAPGRARPEGARAAHAELPAAARWPRAHRGPGQRAHHGIGAQLLRARRGTPARLLQDARRGGHAAALASCSKRRPRIRAGCAICGARCRWAASSASSTPSVQRDIHELFTRSAGDLLDHWFESDAVKALYGFDAVVGSYASPYTPGSAYVLLHHVFGEVNGKTGVWGHAVGGMGAITQAMATEARRLGVTLETDAPVKRIVVERGARHRHRARRWPRDPGQRGRRERRTQAALSSNYWPRPTCPRNSARASSGCASARPRSA